MPFEPDPASDTRSPLPDGALAWRVSARSVAIGLAVAVLGLSLASYAMHLATRAADVGTIAALDVGDEVSLATWFGSGLFVVAALVLLAGRHRALASGEPTRGWLSLAVVMLALSIDEAVSLHERFGSALRDVTGASGFFYYVWVFPAVAFAVAVGVMQLRWLASLPSRTRTWLVIGGVVFMLGAGGLEPLASASDEEHGTETLRSATLTAVEELAEMAGPAIFIVALLDHLAGFRLHVDFAGSANGADPQR